MAAQTGKQIMAGLFGGNRQVGPQQPTSFDAMAAQQIAGQQKSGSVFSGIGDMMQIVAEMRRFLESGAFEQIVQQMNTIAQSGAVDHMIAFAKTAGTLADRMDALDAKMEAIIGRLDAIGGVVIGQPTRGFEQPRGGSGFIDASAPANSFGVEINAGSPYPVRNEEHAQWLKNNPSSQS